MKLLPIIALIMIAISSCKSGPSEDDIKKCVLKDFVCGDYAKVNSLTIVNGSDVEFMGVKGKEFIVNGEVEWTSDCTGAISAVHAGQKETFNNKRVFVRKWDKGWGCEENQN